MQSNAQQTALRAGVNSEVEHGARHAVHHMLHLAAGFLQNEEVVDGEKSRAGWLFEILGDGRTRKFWSTRLGVPCANNVDTSAKTTVRQVHVRERGSCEYGRACMMIFLS